MYFRKFPYISNFEFAKDATPGKVFKLGPSKLTLQVRAYEGGITRVTAASSLWGKNHSMANLQLPGADRGADSLKLSRPFGLVVRGSDNRPFLRAPAGMAFGVCGQRSMFVFEQEPDMQFYGMGEKMRGLELSGVETKFWNTDIFADFHWKEIENDRPDPMYVSIPYVIVKRGNEYAGLLLDNPHATFITTSRGAEIGGGQMKLQEQKKKYITIGAENGVPDLYIITGPSLAELTQKLQRLVGTTPLPPAWSLGYHQCRWGYKSEACLDDLDKKFTEHGIPCDGLWVDIDYMDKFKVFTFNREYFPSVDRVIKKLRKKGRRLIPIIDPGVKQEKKYSVYDSGRKADVFCRNPQGREFIGLVWPGETVFPDFSLPEARRWWARWVKDFAAHGIPGCWIDMNDPSTGHVLNEDMLFGRGKHPHDAYHNQYALGMAMATREGFEAAHPGERPFVITRSGSTGISKHAAIWTGDNISSYHYVRNCIAVSLNLALSGVPFNGPDIGGFAYNGTAQLMQDWMKTCFLFPFARNHSCVGTAHQEPWAFDEPTLRVVKHYIQLRYALRPYLYNLFVRQEEHGDAILRPLFYEFADTAELPLGYVDDAFLTGPAILQAPVLSEHERAREVPLPGGQDWFSVMDGKWISGGRKLKVIVGHLQTPIYLREGSIIPMTPSLPETNAFNSREVAFHVMLKKDSAQPATCEYVFDDGISYDYKNGKRSKFLVTATVRDGHLSIETKLAANGYGKCRPSFVVYDEFASVSIDGQPATATPVKQFMAGSDLTVWTTAKSSSTPAT